MRMMVGVPVFLSCVLLLLLALLPLVVLFFHFLPLFLNFRASIPSGIFGWPLVGETLSFLTPHASNSLGAFLEQHVSRYGKVFKSHLFCTPTVVSCDQELNQFILQNEEKLFQCSYPKPIHGILGKSSMIVVVGDTHKRLRNLALTLITTTKSKPSYLNDIESIAIHVLNSWKDKSNVFFCEEAKKFTFSVIVKQVLGLSPDEPQTSKILEDFLTFMKGFVSFPLYIPGTSYAKAVKARAKISFTVKSVMEERRRKHGEDSAKQQQKGDHFLDVLLSLTNLSEDEKVSFVLDSLFGGYETTSVLMSMAVFFLGQSPSALQQLKQEHEEIKAKRNKDEYYLSSEDYKQMEFTQNVINEALRCGNIVKFVHRKALKDVTFQGHLIPAGWKVLPVFSAVHLDSSLHDNALEFHPWRWEKQGQMTCKKFTPFGGGSRVCPGFELAKVETAVFLHHLVLNFRWKQEGEDCPIAHPFVEFPRALPLEIEPILMESSL
ncbi:Cytochrome P450 B-class protein [Dioscorea alata]|uniref:Cytochrome P450 B-class protein n=1 Tax=Dioscorea alata TaxID=55571 RepID=A0ACB7VJN5_DIOAL|nr:Cytochrome P450 B-class protein [Dioscorea alata]